VNTSNRFKPNALSLAALALLASSAVNAQTQLEPVLVEGRAEGYAAPPSRTATKTDTPLLLTPQSVQVIPREVLDDQLALSLLDATRNVAGTGVDFGFGGSSQPLLILRGFPTVSMSASGPTSTSYYFNGSKVQGLPLVMSNVESVEVIKGPASVLYGRGEPGGMINVVSRQPQATPRLALEQTLGSHGTTRTALEATGPLTADRQWLGRAAASYDDTGSNRFEVEDRLTGAAASLAWVPSAATRVALSLDYSDQKFRNDYGIPAIGNRPADVNLDNQFNEGTPISRSRNTVLRLDGTQALAADWSLNAHLLSLRQRGDQFDLIPTTFFSGQDGLAATGNIDRLYNYTLGQQRSLYQLNADLSGKLRTGSIRHTLLVGVDTYRDRFDSQTTSFVAGPPINIFDPLYGQVPPLDLSTTPLYPREGRTEWTGVYVQDQLNLGSGVELLLGVRHDRTESRYGAPGTEPNQQNFTSPRVGLVWQFNPSQSVYAQFQDGVAANNGRNLAGEALDAEEGRLYEVGTKFERADKRLSATVALYQLTKKNISNYVPDPSGFFDTLAVGEARSRGLEVDVQGQITRQIALLGSYATTTTEVTRDENHLGKRLPNVPRHAASLWLRYQLDANWQFGGGLFAQGRREGDQGNSFQLPGYGRVDAMAAYRFKLGGAASSLQINVNNLFDREYFAGSHQHVTDWIQPGSPRSVFATLRISH
jgi:iron complex outermembrane receptor protein